jgi:hypothetical protein
LVGAAARRGRQTTRDAAHHNLAEYVAAYIEAAGIGDEKLVRPTVSVSVRRTPTNPSSKWVATQRCWMSNSSRRKTLCPNHNRRARKV